MFCVCFTFKKIVGIVMLISLLLENLFEKICTGTKNFNQPPSVEIGDDSSNVDEHRHEHVRVHEKGFCHQMSRDFPEF